MTLNLPKRLEDDLKNFCKLNKMKVGDYVQRCIEEKLAIDKFGDLNEILYGDKIEEVPIPKTEIKPIVEKVPERVSEPVVPEVKQVETVNIEETPQQIIEKKTIKRTRTIKAK